MPGPSTQSPSDRILWILANRGGKMTRSFTSQGCGNKAGGSRYHLADLEREGRIKRALGKHGELVSLKE